MVSCAWAVLTMHHLDPGGHTRAADARGLEWTAVSAIWVPGTEAKNTDA